MQVEIAGVDVDEAANRQMRDLMGEDFADLLETYLSGGEAYVAQILQGFEAQDFAALENAAHPLKSSSRNLGAVRVASLAQNIEHYAKAQDAVAMAEYVGQIGDAFAAAKSALNGGV